MQQEYNKGWLTKGSSRKREAEGGIMGERADGSVQRGGRVYICWKVVFKPRKQSNGFSQPKPYLRLRKAWQSAVILRLLHLMLCGRCYSFLPLWLPSNLVSYSMALIFDPYNHGTAEPFRLLLDALLQAHLIWHSWLRRNIVSCPAFLIWLLEEDVLVVSYSLKSLSWYSVSDHSYYGPPGSPVSFSITRTFSRCTTRRPLAYSRSDLYNTHNQIPLLFIESLHIYLSGRNEDLVPRVHMNQLTTFNQSSKNHEVH